MTALAASDPLLGFLVSVLLLLCFAWFKFKAVITPLPIGLLYLIERLKIESNNDEHNKLLSLFNVNFSGNIKNMKTSLDYNQAKTDQLIGDILEKKMKKVIKDKLDNKFNNIIENLLE